MHRTTERPGTSSKTLRHMLGALAALSIVSSTFAQPTLTPELAVETSIAEGAVVYQRPAGEN